VCVAAGRETGHLCRFCIQAVAVATALLTAYSMSARCLPHEKRTCIAHSCCTRTRTSTVMCGGVVACMCVTMVCIAAYYEHTDELVDTPTSGVTEHGNGVVHRTSPHPVVSSVVRRRNPLLCFIITMNASLSAVRVSQHLTCHPFLGSRTTDQVFRLVSPRVRNNLLKNTSSWGADFTNNQSVSIAYNHFQLWQRLANQTADADMLIFEDDVLITARAVQLYDKIHRSGLLPQHNFILKLSNRHRMQWLGGSELRSVYEFWLGDRSFTLQQCVCRTRQNFFGSSAYVLDRQAALVLLEHHLPLQVHIDMFMHYVGCRVSNFFVLDVDVVASTGRLSTHMSPTESFYRKWPDFKEQVRSFWLSTCY